MHRELDANAGRNDENDGGDGTQLDARHSHEAKQLNLHQANYHHLHNKEKKIYINV